MEDQGATCHELEGKGKNMDRVKFRNGEEQRDSEFSVGKNFFLDEL